MKDLFKRFFLKADQDNELNLPKDENPKFHLRIDNIIIATLRYTDGLWEFKYTKEFKELSDIYNTIAGFSNLDKTYLSETLWPFFQTRIPGLKQPAIIEIIKQENMDKNNEFELLKRFGKRSINNPYILELV